MKDCYYDVDRPRHDGPPHAGGAIRTCRLCKHLHDAIVAATLRRKGGLT